MKAIATASAFALIATPALAGTTCNFNVECYMTEPCEGSGWELTLDTGAQALSTVFGELDVLHTSADGHQVVAEGPGALYLLTIGEPISLFTTHTGAEPATITYVGECTAE